MKQFFIKLSLFTIFLLFADVCLSGFFTLLNKTKGGSIQKVHTIMTQTTPELLILGSSRASHHYNPNIIGDSLNKTVYNGGLDGQGTTIAYGFLKAIGQRRYPKFIICEITPKFDLYDSETSIALDTFYPYIEKNAIKELLIDFDPNEKWKLLSNSYRLNSQLFRIISSVVFPNNEFKNGYQPLSGNLKIDHLKEKNDSYSNTTINNLKEKYLRLLIEDALKNNCKIVFTISPQYNNSNLSYYQDEINIIKEYDVPIINHLNDDKIIHNPSYFQDLVHLNDSGAAVYSNIIVDNMKSIFNED